MTEAAAGGAPCEALPWDSAHFGLRIGRMTVRRPSAEEMARALEWCREEAIDCLYLLADARDPATVRRAEAAGFELVDVRVTLERGLEGAQRRHEAGETAAGETAGGRASEAGEATGDSSESGDASHTGAGTDRVEVAEFARSRSYSGRGSEHEGPGSDLPSPFVIRAAVVPDDLPPLGGLAAAAHRGTRFFNDPCFPDADCERLYRIWIEGSARGRADAVLVAEAAGADPAAAREVAGYVTCHLGGGSVSAGAGQPAASVVGSIGLIGVGARHRGSGLGAALVAAALDWLAAHGAGRVEVVTQGANVAAQRLYQRTGFVTREVGLWYHLWPGRPRPAIATVPEDATP